MYGKTRKNGKRTEGAKAKICNSSFCINTRVLLKLEKLEIKPL